MKLSYCSSLLFCKILGLTPFLTAFTYSHVNEQYGNFLIVGGTGWHEVPSAFLLRASYSAVFHSYLKAASRLTYFSLAVDTVSFTLSQAEDLSHMVLVFGAAWPDSRRQGECWLQRQKAKYFEKDCKELVLWERKTSMKLRQFMVWQFMVWQCHVLGVHAQGSHICFGFLLESGPVCRISGSSLT